MVDLSGFVAVEVATAKWCPLKTIAVILHNLEINI